MCCFSGGRGKNRNKRRQKQIPFGNDNKIRGRESYAFRMTFTVRNFLVGLLVCLASAMAQAPRAAFEIATVKAAPGADPSTGSWTIPGVGRFNASHVSVDLLMQLAYGVDSSQIANKPGWLDSDLFDVATKPEEGLKLTSEELQPRLQSLLAERFHLVVHKETRPVRGYALVVAKEGPRMTPTKGERSPGWKTNVSPGQMRGINWSMPMFAKYLTPAAGFPVVDQTGLAGSFDISFSYAKNADVESTLPALPVALKEATGLVLKPGMVRVETVVIDSVGRVPVEN
jgi:uncharacterized protein (TIGR03435 family)